MTWESTVVGISLVPRLVAELFDLVGPPFQPALKLVISC